MNFRRAVASAALALALGGTTIPLAASIAATPASELDCAPSMEDAMTCSHGGSIYKAFLDGDGNAIGGTQVY